MAAASKFTIIHDSLTEHQKQMLQQGKEAADRSALLSQILGGGDGGLDGHGMPESMKAIVKAICLKAHIPVPEYLGSDVTAPPDAAYSDLNRSGAPMLFVNPLLGEFMSKDELTGILAHELGHIHLKHMEQKRHWLETIGLPKGQEQNLMLYTPKMFTELTNLMHNQEFEADAFAKSLGYGPGLADSLHHDHGMDNIWHEGGVSHPSDAERIARLEA